MKLSDIPSDQAAAYAVANPKMAIKIAKKFPEHAANIVKRLGGKYAVAIAKAVPKQAESIMRKGGCSEKERARIAEIDPAKLVPVLLDEIDWRWYQQKEARCAELARQYPDFVSLITAKIFSPGLEYDALKYVVAVLEAVPEKAGEIMRAVPEGLYEYRWSYYTPPPPEKVIRPRWLVAHHLAYRVPSVAADIAAAVPEAAISIADDVPDKAGEIAKHLPKKAVGIVKKVPGSVGEICQIFPERFDELVAACPKTAAAALSLLDRFPARADEILAAFPRCAVAIAKRHPELFKLEK